MAAFSQVPNSDIQGSPLPPDAYETQLIALAMTME
jgi:hypothetical protein